MTPRNSDSVLVKLLRSSLKESVRPQSNVECLMEFWRFFFHWESLFQMCVSQCNGATHKHQVLLEIGENCNRAAWNVVESVREGGREQKMCSRMVETLSRREANDWGWVTFGSAIYKQKSRNNRESATNAGTRAATDANIDCGGSGHWEGHSAHHRPWWFG